MLAIQIFEDNIIQRCTNLILNLKGKAVGYLKKMVFINFYLPIRQENLHANKNITVDNVWKRSQIISGSVMFVMRACTVQSPHVYSEEWLDEICGVAEEITERYSLGTLYILF